MLRLHGFVESSYYSVVKLTLLEKGLDFEGVHVPLREGGRLVPDPRTVYDWDTYRSTGLKGLVTRVAERVSVRRVLGDRDAVG